jgi:hypothetical protein
MAKQVITTFVDDIDGTEAHRTFTFAVEDIAYEIDLHEENIKGFYAAVDEFVEKSRKVGKVSVAARKSVGRPRGSGAVRADREQTAAIREWASKAGHKINARGRIPAHVAEAYHQAV